MLQQTSLRVKKSYFPQIAKAFVTVSHETIHKVLERVSHGDFVTANSDEERNVMKLMKRFG